MGLTYPILDGSVVFDRSLPEYHKSRVLKRAARFGVRGLPPLPQVDVKAPPTVAFVNHNRWLAPCPDCGSAEHVWLDFPVMLCGECWNAAIGGLYRRVLLPENITEIERALAMRPIPQTRNWHPPETVDFLWAENQAHALQGA